MSFNIDKSFADSLLADLVRINSVNPDLSPTGAGEAEISNHLAGVLKESGLDVTLHEHAPGRVSVTGVKRGTGGGKSLMLNAHIDTVGVEGMPDPFSATIRDGKLYGRGAYDMKGSMAACVAAARALVEAGVELKGDLVVAGVADEENASMGTMELVETLPVDCAIVTEPSALDVCVAHKGFVWIDIVTRGRAAHGSKPELGRDANMAMGRILGRFDQLNRDLAAGFKHPLVGPASLHAATIHGGTGISTYSAECRLQVERRTIPGENADKVEAEVVSILESIRATDPDLIADYSISLVRSPFEARRGSSVVEAVRKAATNVRGQKPGTIGETPWMDSAILADAGVDTVVMGVDGGGAHAAEEWVQLDSVHQLAEILALSAADICNQD